MWRMGKYLRRFATMLDHVKEDLILRRFVIRSRGRDFIFVSSTIDLLMEMEPGCPEDADTERDRTGRDLIGQKGPQ